MSCSNCFNGCADIVSDQCVKYTGINVPELGINTGDTLLTVENKITEKILTLLTGAGIIPDIDPDDICTIVGNYLPCQGCLTINLNDILTALIKATCAVEARLATAEGKITTLLADMAALNADYNLPTPGPTGPCLTGVTNTSDTHQMVQAVIDKICALAVEVSTQYVLKTDINKYIQSYLSTNVVSDLISSKMIPYVVYPYYVLDLTINFGPTGIGLGLWDKVYLCNGLSHPDVPDLRGRVIVGTTSMPMTTGLGAAVDPANPGNPTYDKAGVTGGANTVIITTDQMPSHKHPNTVTIVDPGHTHTYLNSYRDNSNEGPLICTGSDDEGQAGVHKLGTWQDYNNPAVPTLSGLIGSNPPPGKTQNVTVDVKEAGGDGAHPNVQPVMAFNYIIYIP